MAFIYVIPVQLFFFLCFFILVASDWKFFIIIFTLTKLTANLKNEKKTEIMKWQHAQATNFSENLQKWRREGEKKNYGNKQIGRSPNHRRHLFKCVVHKLNDHLMVKYYNISSMRVLILHAVDNDQMANKIVCPEASMRSMLSDW